MPLLTSHGFSLLIAGAEGWGKSDLKVPDNVPEERIKFSGYIPISELVRLYNVADVYVSASLNEGFGLPQLEAMCCGCPVVSSHNSAMIEIVDGAGETVTGWNKSEWISTILKVAHNRDYYIARGLQRAEKYNWDLIIQQLVNYIDKKY